MDSHQPSFQHAAQRAQHQSQQHYQQSSLSSSNAQTGLSQPYQQQQQQIDDSQRSPPAGHSQSRSRTFSFHSDKSKDKSHKRGSSETENAETHQEKEARRLRSKADPTLAMSEAEPSVEAAQTHSSLTPLRSMQHEDAYGNPIVEPDQSNPTRNRWERPLETIRSFNDAVEGGYKRRSMMRTDTEPSNNWSRRNSHHPAPQPRSRPDSYYGSRPVSFRPENTQFSLHQAPGQRAGSVYGMERYQQDNYSNYGGHANRQRAYRMHGEPQSGHQGGGQARGPGGYHLSHQDRSYETVTSAAEGSRHSDQIGYQTDPTSSDNSSIERRSPARRPEPQNDYGVGFSQPQQPQQQHRPPQPPAHGAQGQQAIPRKSVPATLQRQNTQLSTATAGGDKRKSWFMRKFSSKKD